MTSELFAQTGKLIFNAPLAKLYYVLVKEQKEYEPESAAKYEAKQQARTVQKLTKQAAALGYELRALAV